MTIHEWFDSVPERLQTSAHVKTLYGEPIVAEGRTIVPVAKIAYGFGGGSRGTNDEHHLSTDHADQGGGGGGVAAIPIGVVEVTEERTRFIAFDLTKKLAGALAIGLVLGMWIGRGRARE
jgi:uncharacterized spore protein YtfJ